MARSYNNVLRFPGAVRQKVFEQRMAEVSILVEEVVALLTHDDSADPQQMIEKLAIARVKLKQIGDLVLTGQERIEAKEIAELARRTNRLLDLIGGLSKKVIGTGKR